MQAAVAALELGCPPAAVKEALGAATPVKGRMERVELGERADISVMIDFAHTPDALETLLLCAREVCRGRLILVFGCGGDRDKTKRAIMGEIAARLADQVIVTSDNSRSEDPMEIIEQIVAGIPMHTEYRIVPSRERAIRYAILNAGKGDTVLLAGKGHEEYEITRDGKRRFSERQIALAAFAERENTMNEEY
jgi:UDP-N-acetylmuramoyl-L-alanyl-D-glutamate--2,6-diaminopimelate ligase